MRSISKKREITGSLYVIISAILFGCMPLLTKVAYSHGGNAFSVVLGRFLFGALFLFILILVTPGCTVRVSSFYLKDLLKLSILYGITPISLYMSYDYIDSGLATTLHFTYPVAVAVVMMIFYKVKLSRKQIICTLISLSGLVFLYNPGGKTAALGMAIAVFSGITYAFYIVRMGRSYAKELHPFVMTFYLSFFSSIEIGVVALLTGSLTLHIQKEALISEIILSILTVVIALVLFQRGVYWCGEIKASLLSSFEPITGLVIGMTVFSEQITMKELTGIILILASVVIMVIPEKTPKR